MSNDNTEQQSAKSSDSALFAKKEFRRGTIDGLPIVAGYFAVSFSFGILARSTGIDAFIAALISFTNVASAGQFDGLGLIAEGGMYIELFLTQLVINLRYSLMSLSLTQKLGKEFGTARRLIIAYANTDEIFAVASSQKGNVSFPYMLGLEIFPILGWTAGTFAGAVAAGALPGFIVSALSVALYAMFVAIVVPPAREDKGIMAVALIAMAFSLAFYYLPVLSEIGSGFRIIICTLIASALGAAFFPVKEEPENDRKDSLDGISESEVSV